MNYEEMDKIAKAINESKGELTQDILQIDQTTLKSVLAVYVEYVPAYDVRIEKANRLWASQFFTDHCNDINWMNKYLDYNAKPRIYPYLHHCHLEYLIRAIREM